MGIASKRISTRDIRSKTMREVPTGRFYALPYPCLSETNRWNIHIPFSRYDVERLHMFAVSYCVKKVFFLVNPLWKKKKPRSTTVGWGCDKVDQFLNVVSRVWWVGNQDIECRKICFLPNAIAVLFSVIDIRKSKFLQVPLDGTVTIVWVVNLE